MILNSGAVSNQAQYTGASVPNPVGWKEEMADTYQVKCINKTDRQNAHERIRNIGGFDAGKQWKLAESDAIVGIESGKWRFFVSVGGKSVGVIIALHNGRKYLKTEADGYQPDNLLSLPECP